MNKVKKEKQNNKIDFNLNQNLNVDLDINPDIDDYVFNDNTNFLDEEYFIVNLRVKQRNARKYITTIENIPLKYLSNTDKLNNFLIKLRNAISSRATFKKEKDEQFIEVSGNKTDIMVKLLCEFLDCSSDMIKVHG